MNHWQLKQTLDLKCTSIAMRTIKRVGRFQREKNGAQRSRAQANASVWLKIKLCLSNQHVWLKKSWAWTQVLRFTCPPSYALGQGYCVE
jgi:hypothetical protein